METPYRGPGTHLQLQQEGTETRIVGFIDRFEGLKVEVTEWKNYLNCCAVSLVEINWQFSSFSKVISNLSN